MADPATKAGAAPNSSRRALGFGVSGKCPAAAATFLIKELRSIGWEGVGRRRFD